MLAGGADGCISPLSIAGFARMRALCTKFNHRLVLLQLTASLAEWLRRPPRERKIRGSNPACVWIFPGSSHTSDLKIGTPVATLPGAWRYRVSTGTGWPGVSIL